MNKVLIGIDTGVHTGFAVAFDQGKGGELQEVESLTITQAMSKVLEFAKENGKENLMLFIEDARLRTWFGRIDSEQRNMVPEFVRVLDLSNVMHRFGSNGVSNKT